MYSLSDSISILERTPASLRTLLDGLPEKWTHATEGPDTWSAYDIIGHLIHGERTDWIPRARHILDRNPEPFEPFDRFAQFTESKGKNLGELLDSFESLRKESIQSLKQFNLTDQELQLKGTHPALGTVTLSQLLATWTVHDLNHIAQISRVMAKVYSAETGPWREYLTILHR
ncbi:MAG: DinB family protein [Rhodothermaceae bacterium]|nr:DinB family protein [Rhodothermaceae bacterium]